MSEKIEIKKSNILAEFIEAAKNPEKYNFSFHSDWGSLIVWRPFNWRDFSFIHFTICALDVETNCYSKYFEIHFALLGLHFEFDFYR